VSDPGFDHRGGRAVIAKGVEQNLPAAIELPAKDPVWTVGFIERSAAVLNLGPQVLRSVFVLEAFDSLALGTREEKADHPVVEASIHEVVDNCA
jgi:hypothetical protein